MTNRLVLNLAQGASAYALDDSDLRTRTGFEFPSFATGSVLGNIGGPVGVYMDENEDEAELADREEDAENAEGTAGPLTWSRIEKEQIHDTGDPIQRTGSTIEMEDV